MMPHSALYVGAVMHRRYRPRTHYLRYRVFWLLLDLDEVGVLAQDLRWFGYNRFRALSFYDADHGDGSQTPIRDQVRRHLLTAGIATPDGPIQLFCMPRIFGYAFNPLSIYFCYRSDGFLAAVLYEVHNTFGERHSYLIAVEPGVRDIINHRCQKEFYVSPFMDMNVNYVFRLAIPDERISVTIDTVDRAGTVLTAALSGKRLALSDATLRRVLATHPLLTLKVVAGIHWHALRLLLKGLKLRPRPRPPEEQVTVVNVQRSST
jgi:uncharacterized protein